MNLSKYLDPLDYNKFNDALFHVGKLIKRLREMELEYMTGDKGDGSVSLTELTITRKRFENAMQQLYAAMYENKLDPSDTCCGETMYFVGDVRGICFYIKEDVHSLDIGKYDIFVYPVKADENAGTAKIPATLYIGDYGLLGIFDRARYVIEIYPGIRLTSATGCMWHMAGILPDSFFDSHGELGD